MTTSNPGLQHAEARSGAWRNPSFPILPSDEQVNDALKSLQPTWHLAGSALEREGATVLAFLDKAVCRDSSVGAAGLGANPHILFVMFRLWRATQVPTQHGDFSGGFLGYRSFLSFLIRKLPFPLSIRNAARSTRPSCTIKTRSELAKLFPVCTTNSWFGVLRGHRIPYLPGVKMTEAGLAWGTRTLRDAFFPKYFANHIVRTHAWKFDTPRNRVPLAEPGAKPRWCKVLEDDSQFVLLTGALGIAVEDLVLEVRDDHRTVVVRRVSLGTRAFLEDECASFMADGMVHSTGSSLLPRPFSAEETIRMPRQVDPNVDNWIIESENGALGVTIPKKRRSNPVG